MSKITYDANLLKLMTLFETVTRSRVKDCFTDDNELLTFVVNDFQLGKAVGKGASNVKKLENMLKRKIKILGFNPNPVQFIKNLIYPVKAEVEFNDNIVQIKVNDSKSKAFLFGRNRVNLNNNLKITNKYFKEIKAIKIV